MARQFKITASKHSSGLWRIQIPSRLSPSGKRKDEYFKTKVLATNRILELSQKADLLRHGERFMSPDEYAELLGEISRLDGFNVSIHEVISYYIERHRDRDEKAISVLLPLYMESVKDLAKEYQSILRQFLRKVEEKFGGVCIDDITHDMFESWVNEIKPSAKSFNSFLRHVNPFFNWAVSKQFAYRSPTEGIQSKRTSASMIEILSVEQARRLLGACRDYRADDSIAEFMRVDARGFRTIIAVMLFAGIRPKEATRLDWSAIMWEQGVIKILPEVSKTNSVRLIRIEDNLRGFLEAVPEADRVGLIGGKNFKRKWQVVRHVAGIADKNDVTRHSYASYWLALHRDTHGLLENMGHTTSKTTIKHYLTATIKSDAEEYFGIMMLSYE